MIRNGTGTAAIAGTGHGRQRDVGISLRWSAWRCRMRSLAQGNIPRSSGFSPAARFSEYFGGASTPSTLESGTHQIPDKSGLPSAVRGVGAERLGVPSGLRGSLGLAT